jgi:hypothetical protein
MLYIKIVVMHENMTSINNDLESRLALRACCVPLSL